MKGNQILKDRKLLLAHYADPLFVQYIAKIKGMRPFVPKWDGKLSTEEWAYQTGKQAGFDFVISLLDGDEK